MNEGEKIGLLRARAFCALINPGPRYKAGSITMCRIVTLFWTMQFVLGFFFVGGRLFVRYRGEGFRAVHWYDKGLCIITCIIGTFIFVGPVICKSKSC